MQKNPDSSSAVTARKGQTLARTLGAGEYSLVVDNGAADGWYFLLLTEWEKGGETGGAKTIRDVSKIGLNGFAE